MRIVVPLVLALAIAAASDAQTIRGTITGTVTDSTGAVVPGAAVVMTHAATGVTTSAVSNPLGIYTIPLLQPGTYDVGVTWLAYSNHSSNQAFAVYDGNTLLGNFTVNQIQGVTRSGL
jgi:hypothetical protein